MNHQGSKPPRKDVESELREQGELLRVLTANAADFIRLHDLQGRSVYSSPSVERLYGTQPCGLFEFCHPDDLDRAQRWWRQIVAGETGERLVWRVRDANGAWRWLETVASGVQFHGRAHVLTVCRDIADRKRMEERLQQAEEQARKMLDTIPDQIWSGPADGTLDYCNYQWRAYAGLTLEETQGAGWLRVLHPDDKDRVLSAWRDCVATGKPYEQEERHRRADGVYRWFLCRGVAMTDASGRIERWFGSNLDIEELRTNQEKLRQTETELARVARLTIAGELTAMIAHEVNQPLAAVVTNANAAARWLTVQPPNLNEVREAVQRVARDASRASEVTRRIRALVRKAEPSRAAVKLNELVQESVALARPQLDRQKISWRTDLAPDLPSVNADRVQLQQVILNLLMNAMDSLAEMNDGARNLMVTTRRIDVDRVQVVVEDSGAGIDPADAERLFEPFFTRKPEGLGLGLAISRSIIEAHEGELRAAANQPHGARFSFTLPTAGINPS
jgi:PAS domain S-box-containing protein